MAKTNRESTDTPADEKAVATPKAPKRKPTVTEAPENGQPLLVFWDQPRVYECANTRQTGKQADGRMVLTADKITLRPGLNIVDSGKFEAIHKANRRFAEKVEGQLIQDLGDPRDFAKVVRNEREAERMVANTADGDALRVVLEHERREAVAAAIEDQLEDLDRKDAAKADERRRKRQGNRRRARRL